MYTDKLNTKNSQSLRKSKSITDRLRYMFQFCFILYQFSLEENCYKNISRIEYSTLRLLILLPCKYYSIALHMKCNTPAPAGRTKRVSLQCWADSRHRSPESPASLAERTSESSWAESILRKTFRGRIQREEGTAAVILSRPSGGRGPKPKKQYYIYIVLLRQTEKI